MATVLARQFGEEKKSPSISTSSFDRIPPLGAPKDEKRFWWQRTSAFDADAIATQVNPEETPEPLGYHLIPSQPSVFDDPDTAEKYQPPDNWYAPSKHKRDSVR